MLDDKTILFPSQLVLSVNPTFPQSLSKILFLCNAQHLYNCVKIVLFTHKNPLMRGHVIGASQINGDVSSQLT